MTEPQRRSSIFHSAEMQLRLIELENEGAHALSLVPEVPTPTPVYMSVFETPPSVIRIQAYMAGRNGLKSPAIANMALSGELSRATAPGMLPPVFDTTSPVFRAVDQVMGERAPSPHSRHRNTLHTRPEAPTPSVAQPPVPALRLPAAKSNRSGAESSQRQPAGNSLLSSAASAMPYDVVKMIGASKTTLGSIKNHYSYPENAITDPRAAYAPNESKIYKVKLPRANAAASPRRSAAFGPKSMNTARFAAAPAASGRGDGRREDSPPAATRSSTPTARFQASVVAMKRMDPWQDEDSENEQDPEGDVAAVHPSGAGGEGDDAAATMAPKMGHRRDRARYAEVSFGATKSGAEFTLYDKFASASAEVASGLPGLHEDEMLSLLTDFTDKFPFRQLWGFEEHDDYQAAGPEDSARPLMSRNTVRTVRGRETLTHRHPPSHSQAQSKLAAQTQVPGQPKPTADLNRLFKPHDSARDTFRAATGTGASPTRHPGVRQHDVSYNQVAADVEVAQRMLLSPAVARVCAALAQVAYLLILVPRYRHAIEVLNQFDEVPNLLPDVEMLPAEASSDVQPLVTSILSSFAHIDMALAERKRTGYSHTRPVLLLCIRTTVESILRTYFPYHFLLEAAMAEYLRRYVPKADLPRMVMLLGQRLRTVDMSVPAAAAPTTFGASTVYEPRESRELDAGLASHGDSRYLKSGTDSSPVVKKLGYLPHRGSLVDSKVSSSPLLSVLLMWVPSYTLLDSVVASLLDPGRFGSHLASLESDRASQALLKKARTSLRRWKLIYHLTSSTATRAVSATRQRAASAALSPSASTPSLRTGLGHTSTRLLHTPMFPSHADDETHRERSVELAVARDSPSSSSTSLSPPSSAQTVSTPTPAPVQTAEGGPLYTLHLNLAKLGSHIVDPPLGHSHRLMTDSVHWPSAWGFDEPQSVLADCAASNNSVFPPNPAAGTGSRVALVAHGRIQDKYYLTSAGLVAALGECSSPEGRRYMARQPALQPAVTESALRPVAMDTGILERHEDDWRPETRCGATDLTIVRAASRAQLSLIGRHPLASRGGGISALFSSSSAPLLHPSHATSSSCNSSSSSGTHGRRAPSKVSYLPSGASQRAELQRTLIERVSHRYEKLDVAKMTLEKQTVLRFLETNDAEASMPQQPAGRDPRLRPLRPEDLQEEEVVEETMDEWREELAASNDSFIAHLASRNTLKPSVFSWSSSRPPSSGITYRPKSVPSGAPPIGTGALAPPSPSGRMTADMDAGAEKYLRVSNRVDLPVPQSSTLAASRPTSRSRRASRATGGGSAMASRGASVGGDAAGAALPANGAPPPTYASLPVKTLTAAMGLGTGGGARATSANRTARRGTLLPLSREALGLSAEPEWLASFKAGDSSLKDAMRASRSSQGANQVPREHW